MTDTCTSTPGRGHMYTPNAQSIIENGAARTAASRGQGPETAPDKDGPAARQDCHHRVRDKQVDATCGRRSGAV